MCRIEGGRGITQAGVCPGVTISPAEAKADPGASVWTSGSVEAASVVPKINLALVIC